MNPHRRLTLLFAVIAALSGGGLTACGSDDEPANGSASESESPEQATTQPAGDY